MSKLNFLLDQDGVLTDFLSGAIKALNRDFNKNITLEQYAREFGQWGTYDYYGITMYEFWKSIDNTPNFWLNLKPTPWCFKLYEYLFSLGEVTILTAPNTDPNCVVQKLQWLKLHLDLDSSSVMLGSRKYLMAGNGILIDDYSKNTDAFTAAGGKSILIPSSWNTNNLTFDDILKVIQEQL